VVLWGPSADIFPFPNAFWGSRTTEWACKWGIPRFRRDWAINNGVRQSWVRDYSQHEALTESILGIASWVRICSPVFPAVLGRDNRRSLTGDLMLEQRDNVFRLTVVPIFVVEDQILVVHRHVTPKKLHSWEEGFLGRDLILDRDLIGPHTPLQIVAEIATDLGCRKVNQCTFVASHHERREHKKSKPPYTEFICSLCYLVTLPTKDGIRPEPHTDIANVRWLERQTVFDHLSYDARFWLPFELEEYFRFGTIGKPVALES